VQEIFRKLLEMSMLGSLLALAVIAVRLIFRKAPRWIYCVLWGMVAVRLILPFSVESKISAVPASVATGQILNQVADRYVGSVEVYYESDPHYSNALDAGRLPAYSADGAYVVTQQGSLEAPATVGDTVFPVLFGVWLVGMAGMLVYLLISYWVLRRKVAEATLLRDNIWQCERISPFVLGVLRPRIYLPYALSEGDATHVIAHEQAHIRRRDYLWKPIGFMLLSIHWFNPVMWAAYILLCRDVERACDEKVIKNMDKVQMQAYSTALLHCSAHRRRIAACPLAFGEVGVKERIKRVMYYKKPAFWVIVLVCVVSVVACVLLMTAPEPADRALVKTEYRVTATLYSTATKEDDRYTGFRITEDGTFYAQREGTDTWNHRSTMEEYPLTAEQLRAYAARKENWRPGYTLDAISEALIAREENGYFFLAAQCAQGDTLVGFGREDPTEGTYLRYLYQVEPVTAEESEEPKEDTDNLSDLENVTQAGNTTVFTATDAISGRWATMVPFFAEDPNGEIRDLGIAPWEADYTAGNTLVVDGYSGQNLLQLSPKDYRVTAYKIYNPDGTLYDDGQRESYCSLSPRVMYAAEGTYLISPATPGTYIYEVEFAWKREGNTVTPATCGLKVQVTGKESDFDVALNALVKQYRGDNLLFSASFVQRLPLVGGNYFLFEIRNSVVGTARVAVSADGKHMIEMPAEDAQENKAVTPIRDSAVAFDESSQSGRLAKGNLHHEVVGVRVVTQVDGIPQKGGFAPNESGCTYDSDGNETIWHYPDFIQEDGTFANGLRLVLLDVVITSEEAKNWVKSKGNAYGNNAGLFDDPYLFRIDGIYSLREISATNGDQPFTWTPVFFSEMGTVEAHPFAYRLEPGEKICVTVGFLMGNYWDGSDMDLSTLCIRVPFGLLENDDYRENLFVLKES